MARAFRPTAGEHDVARHHIVGISHVSLVTPDMDATVRFYCGVLGANVKRTWVESDMRLYSLEIVPGVAIDFVEHVGAKTFVKPMLRRTDHPIQLDHVAFRVSTPEALEALRLHLQEAGVETTEVYDSDPAKAFHFRDNNGITLEAVWWPDQERQPAVHLDVNPVPAVAELLRDGRVGWTPRTTLAWGAQQQ
jgi:catechol 2,3-dioxygenase-like lactoylglutathione lyase family enzyme